VRICVLHSEASRASVNIIYVSIKEDPQMRKEFAYMYDQRKRKKKRGCWLAGGLDVDFDFILGTGGEDGYAACGSYVLHTYSAWILDVYG